MLTLNCAVVHLVQPSWWIKSLHQWCTWNSQMVRRDTIFFLIRWGNWGNIAYLFLDIDDNRPNFSLMRWTTACYLLSAEPIANNSSVRIEVLLPQDWDLIRQYCVKLFLRPLEEHQTVSPLSWLFSARGLVQKQDWISKRSCVRLSQKGRTAA